MKELALILKDLRIEKNISQDKLAELLNTTRSAIGNYETGRRVPNYEMLENIADFFNVDMDYLLGRQSIKRKNAIPSFVPGTTEIIDLYSRASEDQRQAVLNLLRSFVAHE
ncbi:MAG: helix-turn-helix transcriptional regulator [Prevotellaceae bacterium]|nr:helix-turn-helix transcriptional regulator [Candidatus Colivivens equi]